MGTKGRKNVKKPKKQQKKGVEKDTKISKESNK